MNEKKENVIVNGFFWRFAERCGVQLISAVVSILLARILTPDDYGKVALVTVFNNIMYVLLDCGIGTALVQHQNDPAGACDPEHEVPVFFLFRLCGRDRIHGPGPGPCLYGFWSLGAGGAAGIQYHGGHAGVVEAVLLAA